MAFVGPEAVPARRAEDGVALVAAQWAGCKLKPAFVTLQTSASKLRSKHNSELDFSF